MQRLTPETFSEFVSANHVAAILFAAPDGEASMEQANEFAETWADHSSEAGFGYLDAFAHVAQARAYGVRILPTTIVTHEGVEIARHEGRCPSARLSVAIATADVFASARAA
jgi:hypothetical protein